tara:strand:+ start:6930 stop:7520 length:591 start_codon:yes stop_codon:yes gene_type:complete
MKRGKMKHLIILLSLLSTLIITGCGGGNNAGGNTAGVAQNNQQLENPKILAEANQQNRNTDQALVEQNLEKNIDNSTEKSNVLDKDSITKTDIQTDSVINTDSRSGSADTTDSANNDPEISTQASASTSSLSTEDVVNLQGTVSATDESDNESVEDFNVDVAFVRDLKASDRFSNIERITLNAQKGENIPDLAMLR